MPDNDKPNFDEVFGNKLKTLDTATLEKSIADVLNNLLGVEYKCSVDKISYGDMRTKGGAFRVKLAEKNPYDSTKRKLTS